MVTRKPVPGHPSINPNVPPQLRMQDVRQELWSATESEASAETPWAAGRQYPMQRDGPGAPSQGIPPSLRPGGPGAFPGSEGAGESVWGEEANRLHPSGQSGPDLGHTSSAFQLGGGGPSGGAGSGVARTETNPFKRKPSVGAGLGAANVPPVPTQVPSAPPLQSLAQMSLNESTNNPWRPAVDAPPSSLAPPAPVAAGDGDSGRDVWAAQDASRATTPAPASKSPALLSLPSEEGSADWGEVSVQGNTPSPLSRPAQPVDGDEVLEDSHAWDDLGTQDKGKAPVALPQIPAVSSEGPADDWNLIDNEPVPSPPSRQSTWENFDNDEEAPRPKPPTEEQPPALPPRRSVEAEAPPPQPPRPVAAAAKSETYQIKNVNWHDVNAARNPRTSPILVQNANGPCPLVALVNALSLTTPADMQNTALVETLRSREQISLGLLLDAVIEELMSSRRTHPDVPLPDVFELYNFLQGLHTGMNVNPRFIPARETVTAYKRTSLTHLHPTERGDLIPGTFEGTKEMSLYATFSIPLIHGWLPPRSEPAYEALSRRAVSYEDAQNLLFREEELEEKLSSPSQRGLTEEEQEIYQDVLTIKAFLGASATQLTPWGLEVITKAVQPGTFAILFRNDHFSTLYRHPQTLELLALVTDAGYASHAEVVWESLVDVKGEHAEFLSGDFRIVGGAHQQQGGAGPIPGAFPDAPGRGGGEGEWTTVQGRRGGTPRSRPSPDPPLSPQHEQEDRDLALALQLQEEEDERHRAEQARRRRESQLSEQYIEQQAHQPTPVARRGRGGGGPVAPPHSRRSSSQVNLPVTSAAHSPNPSIRGGGAAARGGGGRPVQQQVRPLVPPAATSRPPPAGENGEDDAPPSYEQAAKQTPYVPPAGHPNHPASSPSTRAGSAGPSTPSASSTRLPPRPGAGFPGVAGGSGRVASSSGRVASGGGGGGPYRQGVPPAAAGGGGSGKDKDCIVM